MRFGRPGALIDGELLGGSQGEAGGIVHFLDFGGGGEDFTGVSDAGMVGHGGVAGASWVIHEEKDPVHADFLV